MARNKPGGWKNQETSVASRVVITVVMILLTITFLYPLYYMIINSFKDTTGYYQSQFALPLSLDFDNYRHMLVDFKFLDYFFNTLFIAVMSTAIVMLLSIFASYVFAKIRFHGRSILYIAIISTMFLPAQATLIPQYVMFSKYHLINSPWSVILSYVASSCPGAILLLRASFMGIPNDLIESARIDGAGYFRMIFNLVVPVSVAAISIQIIFSFISFWNDLLTPMLLLTDSMKQTVMVALSTLMSRYGSAPTRQLTGLLLSVVPILVLYLMLQKYMMKGLLEGAVKS